MFGYGKYASRLGFRSESTKKELRATQRVQVVLYIKIRNPQRRNCESILSSNSADSGEYESTKKELRDIYNVYIMSANGVGIHKEGIARRDAVVGGEDGVAVNPQRRNCESSHSSAFLILASQESTKKELRALRRQLRLKATQRRNPQRRNCEFFSVLCFPAYFLGGIHKEGIAS